MSTNWCFNQDKQRGTMRAHFDAASMLEVMDSLLTHERGDLSTITSKPQFSTRWRMSMQFGSRNGIPIRQVNFFHEDLNCLTDILRALRANRFEAVLSSVEVMVNGHT